MEVIINKKHIAEKLAQDHRITMSLAENVIEGIFEHIRSGVNSGNKISLGGFGIFRQKIRAARVCRNPRTGMEVKVPKLKVVKFTAAESFKQLLKQ